MKKLIVFSSFLFLLTFSVSFSQSLNDSLIAYWSFDDSTAHDFSGHARHGTLVNNPKPVPGVKGSAFWFSGGNYEGADGCHITLPMIDFNSMKEFTVSLWVNEEDMITYHGDAYIFFGDWQGGYLGILNHFDNYDFNGEDLYLSFCVGAKGESDQSKIIVHYDKSKYRNKWILFSMTYKNGLLKGYINGSLAGSTTNETVSVGGNNAALGRHWWYNGTKTATRFRGSMDEVRIYNRALSDEEIGKLYKPEESGCGNMAFSYDKFDGKSSINYNKDAQRVDSVIKLTSAAINRTGSAWFQNKLPLSAGFSTTFRFRFNNGTNFGNNDGSYPGADGIALVIQNDRKDAWGDLGGGIGYQGIPNALAIEFDAYKNDSTQITNLFDPNGNHLAIMSNGWQPISAAHTQGKTLGMNDKIISMRSDGTVYYAKVEYNVKPNTMTVYLDTTGLFINPVLEVKSLELNKILDMDSGKFAYIGFTSATGNACQTHEILGWQICLFDSTSTGIVEDKSVSAPEAYPNPFSRSLTVSYSLEENAFVDLKICDIFGREVTTLVNSNQDKGNHEATWNGNGCANGLYYYTLRINNHVTSGKVVLNR